MTLHKRDLRSGSHGRATRAGGLLLTLPALTVAEAGAPLGPATPASASVSATRAFASVGSPARRGT